MIMKEQTNKANNLQCGRIYINATTGQPCRLVNIVACEGAWLETYDGQGYGVTVSFEDVHYASQDEVEDYLEDLRAYTASEKAPSHKSPVRYDEGLDEDEIASYESKHDITPNYDRQWNVQGYYNDDNGNDIRCRD